MSQIKELNIEKSIAEGLEIKSDKISTDASKVSNIVLKRLMEEVRYEKQNNILAYDRAHNRHNRGR